MNKLLVVSDTNIFIDLISVNLLDEFFKLPFRIATTDFIINELTDSIQRGIIDKFVVSKKLAVKNFNSSEFMEIISLKNTCSTNASISDCSVWYLPKITSSTLLTGDSKLRRVCESDSITVAGILFIMDELLEFKICEKMVMSEKLVELMTVNSRLPHGECKKRLELWRK